MCVRVCVCVCVCTQTEKGHKDALSTPAKGTHQDSERAKGTHQDSERAKGTHQDSERAGHRFLRSFKQLCTILKKTLVRARNDAIS